MIDVPEILESEILGNPEILCSGANEVTIRYIIKYVKVSQKNAKTHYWKASNIQSKRIILTLRLFKIDLVA